MKNRVNKMIAPFVITLVVIFYYVIFGIVIVRLNINFALKAAAVIIPLIIIIITIVVLIERIKEINSGEEEGLEKY